MLITKADGSREEFDKEKLRASLRRAGAKKTAIDSIVAEVEAVMHEGIRTNEIYRHAFSHLREEDTSVVARYALRRALFGLGPSGFPFEAFLSRLFEAEGYNTRVGIVLQGKCAKHEIDLAAYKDDHAFIAEAKFHNRPGLRSDLKVAMYSYARLTDLSEQKICSADICGVKNLKIVTNTKFTSAAVKYAKCSGVDLLSWEYPKQNNLFDLIDKHRLYPLTVLQSITQSQKKLLLADGLIVCEDLLRQKNKLKQLSLSKKRMETLLSEVSQLSSQS